MTLVVQGAVARASKRKICGSCGGGFRCAAPSAGCWCEAVDLDRGALAALRERFTDCLCPRCLGAETSPMKQPAREAKRCHWATSPLMAEYHDREWGRPVHDDRRLFEFLILEGAQAGLSWETILKKRENYRRAFDRFDPRKIALYDARKVRALLRDPGIVRNRLKIASTISNAKAFLAVQKEFGSFDKYAWRFVGGKPKLNRWKDSKRVPARTPGSDAMSKDLKKRGFRFAGSTICYAFMQAVGMVDDHAADCFRR